VDDRLVGLPSLVLDTEDGGQPILADANKSVLELGHLEFTSFPSATKHRRRVRQAHRGARGSSRWERRDPTSWRPSRAGARTALSTAGARRETVATEESSGSTRVTDCANLSHGDRREETRWR